MRMVKKAKPTEKTVSFKSTPDLRKWFEANHHKCDGIWLRIFKKKSGRVSVNYAEALDEALCFGWIDGLKLPKDELSWLQRFTPRRAKSKWSKINTGRFMASIRYGLQHLSPALQGAIECQFVGKFQSAAGRQAKPDAGDF